MTYKELKLRVYKYLATIPKGKVDTYGNISKKLDINSPRLIGKMLHENIDPKQFPCHRVVYSDGRVAKKYAFGGDESQIAKLKGEGIIFINGKVDMKNHLV